jgi:hypothetical protein
MVIRVGSGLSAFRHCGHEFLRQGRDGPTAVIPPTRFLSRTRSHRATPAQSEQLYTDKYWKWGAGFGLGSGGYSKVEAPR